MKKTKLPIFQYGYIESKKINQARITPPKYSPKKENIRPKLSTQLSSRSNLPSNKIQHKSKQPIHATVNTSQPQNKQVIFVSDDDSSIDSSCEGMSDDCTCEPRFPLYQSKIKQHIVRRRKKHHVPYYEQSILELDRMPRTRFRDTSSSESEEPIDTRRYVRRNSNDQNPIQQPTQQQYPSQQQQPLLQQSYQPLPKIAPLQNNNRQRTQSPPSVSNPMRTSKKVNFNKQSPQTKGTPSIQDPRVRKRYETPPIVHPQRLRKPSEKMIVAGPTKPLYRKPVDRPRKTQKIVQQQPKQNVTRNMLDQLPRPKANRLKAGQVQSSSSSCLCELMSDCC